MAPPERKDPGVPGGGAPLPDPAPRRPDGDPPRADHAPPRRSGRDFDFSPWTEIAAPRSDALGVRASWPRIGVVERCAALILLIAASPLLALIALAIKLESPKGAILYRQERVGLDRRGTRAPGTAAGLTERRATPGAGRVFWIVKFRTMIPDAEGLTGPVWATRRDPRVTRVGNVLRRLRLDELPQLLNVLRGDMRLIGPRPERPHFVRQLCEQIPEYPARQKVPPGITGLAQVEREYDASVADVERKVRYDLYYARHRSRLLDLKILLKTIEVAIRGRGAR